MQEPMSYNKEMLVAAFVACFICGLLALPLWVSSNPRRALILASGPLFVAGVCIAAVGQQVESGGAVGFGAALLLVVVLIFSVEAMRLLANKTGL